MLEVTPEEFEAAALVLIVAEDGQHRWSSTHSNTDVVNQLHAIADDIMSGEDGQ